ncbi:MAG: hypothetical protein WC124_02210 [Desulfoplanes sp.]
MNQQEIELASKIMAELRNTTGYGYDTLVHGTVISGMIDVVVVGCAVIAAGIATRFVYKVIQEENKTCKYESDKFPPLWAAIIAFVVCGLVALIVFELCGNAIISIFAPEYTVINKIIERAV